MTALVPDERIGKMGKTVSEATASTLPMRDLELRTYNLQ